MKSFLLFIVLVLTSFGLKAQESDANYAQKVKTLDATLETLYGVISGEKGEARDWELFKYLFHPDAKLIPSGKNAKGLYSARFMTPQDYINSSGQWLIDNGFYEVEINRETQSFGNITQVFSSYHSFRSKTDEIPFMRGINSIQLLNDGARWWIINIYWTQETPDNPIPQNYLPKN